jgi:ATP-dependent RNA helicase DDX18/HAS1
VGKTKERVAKRSRPDHDAWSELPEPAPFHAQSALAGVEYGHEQETSSMAGKKRRKKINNKSSSPVTGQDRLARNEAEMDEELPSATALPKKTAARAAPIPRTGSSDAHEVADVATGTDGAGSALEVAEVGAHDVATDGVLTSRQFAELGLAPQTMDALRDMGFDRMTEVQARCLPHGMAGRDVLGAARTGSGKTLAFLIPVVELLVRVKWMNRNGTAAVIISPTRELALQIYGVVADVCKYHTQSYGIVMGGANRKMEAEKLQKGVAILVATPGRLLDHLQNSPGFLVKNLQVLVVDEADRCLEIGFEEEMHQIIKLLPKKRQTMLFSATQTTKVEDLVRISFKNKPVYVGVHDKRDVSTVAGLEQGFVVVPSERRFLLLYTFLRRNLKKKVIVFMSSCNAVKFFYELLNHVDIPVLDLHGRQKQNKRTSTFYKFCKAETAILICTDVAARGLDIPSVDWIIQFDPPDEPKEYIHRVGRTARGVDGKGKALLFLLPSELGFLRHLRAAKVPLNEYEFPEKKMARVQPQLEKLISSNYALNRSAKDGYRSYLQSYASHGMKEIFNVHELDLEAVAKSFCFEDPPRVNLNMMGSAKGERRRGGGGGVGAGYKKNDRLKEIVRQKASGHSFSASNPYGKRAEGDSRQFSR